MLKPLLVACLVGIGTFAIVAGCSAPSTDGDVKKGTSSKGDDDDDDDTSKKGTSSSSSGSAETADCTKLPAADTRPACDTCAKSKCCKEYAACENSSACKAQKQCVEACKDGDIFCILSCANSSDEASDLAGDFAGCLSLSCKSECPAPDAGASGDPFGDDDDAG